MGVDTRCQPVVDSLIVATNSIIEGSVAVNGWQATQWQGVTYWKIMREVRGHNAVWQLRRNQWLRRAGYMRERASWPNVTLRHTLTSECRGGGLITMGWLVLGGLLRIGWPGWPNYPFQFSPPFLQVLAGEEEMPKMRIPMERRHLIHNVQSEKGAAAAHQQLNPWPSRSQVDFFWINRDQKSFEWFVKLLSQLEIEQAEHGGAMSRWANKQQKCEGNKKQTQISQVPRHAHVCHLGAPADRHEGGRASARPRLAPREGAGKNNIFLFYQRW